MKAFGEYVNNCGDDINPLATTNAIELISLDFPDLDIKKSDYMYDATTREQSRWHLAKAMLPVPELSLLELLKSSNHILKVEKVLKSEVDEDKMFRYFDKS